METRHPAKELKNVRESLSADATKFPMPDLATQNGQHDFSQKCAPDDAYARNGCQADGINGTSSSPGKNFINIYDGGRTCDKESVQESIDRSVSFLPDDQDVDRPDKQESCFEAPQRQQKRFQAL